ATLASATLAAATRATTTHAPPLPTSAFQAATSDVATVAGPDSVAFRFLQRFALITLGLYHVPLFLNNYPSL
ncbi:hypothetical protein NF717_12705, partial [Lactococcus formosensis]